MINFSFINQLAQSLKRRNSLHLTQEDVALTQVPKGTDLYKVGQRNLNPDRRAMNIDETQHWTGIYVTDNKKVAHGYGNDASTSNNPKKIEYSMNKFRAASEIPALEIKKPAFGSGAYSGDQKADAIKDFIRTNGVGNFKNMQPKDLMSKSNFDILSKSVKDTFNREKDIRLMPGLDSHKLAFKGPHDQEGNNEIILHRNSIVNIIRNGRTENVVRDA